MEERDCLSSGNFGGELGGIEPDVVLVSTSRNAGVPLFPAFCDPSNTRAGASIGLSVAGILGTGGLTQIVDGVASALAVLVVYLSGRPFTVDIKPS